MNQIEQNINTVQEDEIDLIELFKVFWAHKLMIVIITAIFTVGSVIYAMRLPNIYTAEVTLAPVNSDGNAIAGGLGALGGLASLAGISTSSGSNIAANMAVIKSRQFIMEFIKENKLLPMLFAKQWDSENNKWVVEGQKKAPTLQKGYRKFVSNIVSISESKKTGLITLTVSWYDADLAANWANMFITKANIFIKQKAITEANQSISYLKDQIINTSQVDIQELLYKLIEKELQTAKLASVRKDFAFKVLDPAVPPEIKSRPLRPMICIIGFLIGLLISLVLVFLYRK